MKPSFFKRHNSILRWFPAFLLAIAIFSFSATPGDEVGDSYDSIEATIQVVTTPAVVPVETATASIPPTIDWLKVGHAIGYFWLGFAVLYGLSARSRWSPSLSLILCSLYSVSDEFHQLFIPGRSASAKDILLDTLAALLGVAIMLGWMASKKFFNRRR